MPSVAMSLLLSNLVLSLCIVRIQAFTSPIQHQIRLPPRVGVRVRDGLASTKVHATNNPDVVVISPPGGVGEICSIESAKLGASVKWFVVSAPSKEGGPNQNIALSSATLSAMDEAGGSFELAGATSDSLLSSDDRSSTSAIQSWCASSGSIIVTYDGVSEEKKRVESELTTEERRDAPDSVELLLSAIRVAARQAAGVCNGDVTKVALLGLNEDTVDEKDEKKGPGLLGGLFGGNDDGVPASLDEALNGATSTIRYGELFGASESSPESAPFMGGPRRDPVVREMYTERSIRVDPTVSVSGNVLSGEGTKTNRLSVGEAASRLALNKVVSKGDVSLSSYPGTEPPTDEEWKAAFDRVNKLAKSGAVGALAEFEFKSVKSEKRLAEWLATKWAPAVLRSYDIAGTRVGARPVLALRTSDTTVEIVWQELVDFASVTSGKMIVEVGEKGMTARRAGGDASAGFGAVSRTPLPGEDILVRRLADAASQAVEKGLAKKAKVVGKKVKKVVQPTVVAPVIVSEPAVAAASSTSPPEGAGPGPRSAGKRRSSKRSRGSRKRDKLEEMKSD